MEGVRHSVTSADGVRIGLLTAGSGPALLLVHGGMGTLDSWQRVWGALARQRRVTAMDRRGRGSSGDADTYSLSSEYADVAAVAAALASDQGGPVDVAGHSIGATCVLGAAAGAAPFRRIVLYEPPGPQATPDNWPERVTTMMAAGQAGRAVFTFLTEIVGLTRGEVEALRDAPGGRDVLPIAAATLPREAHALAAADLTGLARLVRQPVRLLLGTASPPWAGEITQELAAALPAATVTELPGVGHEGLDTAPDLLVAEILRFVDQLTPERP
jgi:pimeloyl-ACP methyl ester carboxylesterase